MIYKPEFNYSIQELKNEANKLIKKSKNKPRNISEDLISDIIYVIWSAYKKYLPNKGKTFSAFIQQRCDWHLLKASKLETKKRQNHEEYTKYIKNKNILYTQTNHITNMEKAQYVYETIKLPPNLNKIFEEKYLRAQPTKSIANNMKVSRQYVEQSLAKIIRIARQQYNR